MEDQLRRILDEPRSLAWLGQVGGPGGNLAIELRRLLGCRDIDQRQLRDGLAQCGPAGEPLRQLAADHAGGPDHQYAQERSP